MEQIGIKPESRERFAGSLGRTARAPVRTASCAIGIPTIVTYEQWLTSTMATTKRRNLARPRNAISSMQRPLNRTFKVCCANGTGNGAHRREQLYREWRTNSPLKSLTLRYTSLRVSLVAAKARNICMHLTPQHGMPRPQQVRAGRGCLANTIWYSNRMAH